MTIRELYWENILIAICFMSFALEYVLINCFVFFNYSFYHQSFFYSPTDAQVNCLKNNFKIYIKIDIKTAPTCFGAVTPSLGSALLMLLKLQLLKQPITQNTAVCGDVAPSPHTAVF
jgi:hypothetical protein